MATSRVGTIYPDWKSGLKALAEALNRVIDGELAVVGNVTLTPSATSTMVTDQRVAPGRAVLLQPTTANAAAALGTTYIAPANVGLGTFDITHASNAQTDRTFRYIILG